MYIYIYICIYIYMCSNVPRADAAGQEEGAALQAALVEGRLRSRVCLRIQQALPSSAKHQLYDDK